MTEETLSRFDYVKRKEYEERILMLTGLSTSMHERAESELKNLSTFPLPPELSSFHVMGIDECIDVFEIFSYEPMREFCRGIENPFKQHLISYCGDER